MQEYLTVLFIYLGQIHQTVVNKKMLKPRFPFNYNNHFLKVDFSMLCMKQQST